MALTAPTSWLVTPADGGSWQTIATALKITKAALLAANGLTSYRPLVVGETLVVPFGVAP